MPSVRSSWVVTIACSPHKPLLAPFRALPGRLFFFVQMYGCRFISTFIMRACQAVFTFTTRDLQRPRVADARPGSISYRVSIRDNNVTRCFGFWLQHFSVGFRRQTWILTTPGTTFRFTFPWLFCLLFLFFLIAFHFLCSTEVIPPEEMCDLPGVLCIGCILPSFGSIRSIDCQFECQTPLFVLISAFPLHQGRYCYCLWNSCLHNFENNQPSVTKFINQTICMKVGATRFYEGPFLLRVCMSRCRLRNVLFHSLRFSLSSFLSRFQIFSFQFCFQPHIAPKNVINTVLQQYMMCLDVTRKKK